MYEKSLRRVITQMLQIKTIKTHYQKYDCQVSKIVFYVKLLYVLQLDYRKIVIDKYLGRYVLVSLC